jgi:hypothetical protein
MPESIEQSCDDLHDTKTSFYGSGYLNGRLWIVIWFLFIKIAWNLSRSGTKRLGPVSQLVSLPLVGDDIVVESPILDSSICRIVHKALILIFGPMVATRYCCHPRCPCSLLKMKMVGETLKSLTSSPVKRFFGSLIRLNCCARHGSFPYIRL